MCVGHSGAGEHHAGAVRHHAGAVKQYNEQRAGARAAMRVMALNSHARLLNSQKAPDQLLHWLHDQGQLPPHARMSSQYIHIMPRAQVDALLELYGYPGQAQKTDVDRRFELLSHLGAPAPDFQEGACVAIAGRPGWSME